jgi:hypothetical protein
MNHPRSILGLLLISMGLLTNIASGERLEESSYLSTPRNSNMALTPGFERLCVAHNIISADDPRGGLNLVDLTTGQVLDTTLFAEEGSVGQVAASADPDGTTRCFVAVTH